MAIKDEDKLMTAYHEGGHTLVNLLTKGAFELHKVTILPRGPALGFTAMMPDRDRYSQNRREILAAIDTALGGRVAEEIIYGNEKITTGCSSDLSKATELAYNYIRTYSMEEDQNLISARKGDMSDSYNFEVDKRVQTLLQESMYRTKELLTINKDRLDKLAKQLVISETMSALEVRATVGL